MKTLPRFVRSVTAAFVVALLLLLGVEAPASATPNFPGVVQQHLTLGAPPACTLCHVGTPALGTVTTPFGVTLRSRGARAYDESAMRTALDALSAEKKDSDADGVPDIDELKAGSDPNTGSGEEVVVPEYGCRAATAGIPGDSRGRPVIGLGAALLMLVIRRRARPAVSDDIRPTRPG